MKNTKVAMINNYLQFYTKAEKLKTTMRHSWLADSNRQESTAEHSWMLGLLAIVLADELERKVDKSKVIEMVIVHDLAEAVTGDIPSFEISTRQNNKHKAEEKALAYIVADLPKKTQKRIIDLWNEFEECKTLEARFANSLDKVEACIQHNLADISTWDDGDYNIGPYYKNHFFDFDSFIRSFKDKVDVDTMQKIVDAKQEKRVSIDHLERFKHKQKFKK